MNEITTGEVVRMFETHAADDVKFQNESQRSDKDIKRALDDQAKRFDRHLEIYAANGKEMAGLKAEMAAFRVEFNSAQETMKGLVTKDQFWPVKTLVYGMVGIMLLGVAGVWVQNALRPATSPNDIKQAVSEALDSKVSKITQP